MKQLVTFFSGLMVLLLVGCAQVPYTAEVLPSDIQITASTTELKQLPIAIYIPQSKIDFGYRVRNTQQTIGLGEVYKSAFNAYGKALFKDVIFIDSRSYQTDGRKFSLYIALYPRWKYHEGGGQITTEYRVRSGNGQLIYEDEHVQHEKQTSAAGNLPLAYSNASIRTAQYILSKIANDIQPTETSFPAIGYAASFSPEQISKIHRPYWLLAGAALNKRGHLLARWRDYNHCVKLETEIDNDPVPLEIVASERILDLTVLKVNRELDYYLGFSQSNKVTIGEPLLMPGFTYSWDDDIVKLQYAFGNIYDSSGLKGSKEVLQYSTTVEPSDSGGPLLNSKASMLGFNAGRYANLSYLVRKDYLPNNVYFGVQIGTVKQFLSNNDISYSKASSNLTGLELSEIASKVTLPIKCYQ